MNNKGSRSTPKKNSKRKDVNRYPKGWDRDRVEAVIAHYENLTDADAVCEDEAPYENRAITMMAVPVELVPKVQKLIATYTS